MKSVLEIIATVLFVVSFAAVCCLSGEIGLTLVALAVMACSMALMEMSDEPEDEV